MLGRTLMDAGLNDNRIKKLGFTQSTLSGLSKCTASEPDKASMLRQTKSARIWQQSAPHILRTKPLQTNIFLNTGGKILMALFVQYGVSLTFSRCLQHHSSKGRSSIDLETDFLRLTVGHPQKASPTPVLYNVYTKGLKGNGLS